MKVLILFILILITQTTFGQSKDKLEVRSIGTFCIANAYEDATLGNSRESMALKGAKADPEIEDKMLMGAKWQAGNRFHNRWSAGVQAGTACYLDGWNFIFPQFRMNASVGVFGEFHVNRMASIVAVSHLNKNTNYAPNVSFGLGPQVYFGTSGKYGIRAMIEYGAAGGSDGAFDYGYDDKGYFQIQESEASNKALSIEIGVVTKLFNI